MAPTVASTESDVNLRLKSLSQLIAFNNDHLIRNGKSHYYFNLIINN